MFFYYAGDKPVDVVIPNEQYAFRIMPSKNCQKTTNEKLYEFLFSPAMGENRTFFRKASGFSDLTIDWSLDFDHDSPSEQPEESHGGDDE